VKNNLILNLALMMTHSVQKLGIGS